MIKRIFAAVCAALFFAMAGCSTPVTVKQDDANGSYVSSGSDTQFGAVIDKGVITVNIEGDGASALYWKGSFVVPDNNGSKFVVQSAADTEALKASMLGSTDPTKDFTYDGGKLTFSFGMMGVTKTVELKKSA